MIKSITLLVCIFFITGCAGIDYNYDRKPCKQKITYHYDSKGKYAGSSVVFDCSENE